jgi:hypothetical protein
MYKDPLVRHDQPELDVLRAAQGSLDAIADGTKSARSPLDGKAELTTLRRGHHPSQRVKYSRTHRPQFMHEALSTAL